jgi:hypothetical protein
MTSAQSTTNNASIDYSKPGLEFLAALKKAGTLRSGRSKDSESNAAGHVGTFSSYNHRQGSGK